MRLYSLSDVRMDHVRGARVAVLTLSIGLPVIETTNLVLAAVPWSVAAVVGAGVALVLPLHLRHVLAGLRGEPPVHPAWTLAAMAVVLAVVTPIGGSATALLLACLACSVLVTVPAPWSLLGLVACAGWAWMLGGPHVVPDLARSGPYLALAVVFRAVSVFLLIWLVAARARLEANREEVAAAAVDAERAGVASEMLRSARPVIAGFPPAARGVAGALAAGEPDVAITRVNALVEAARSVLGEVRRTLRSRTGGTLQAAGELLDGPTAPSRDPAPAGVFPDDRGPGGIAFERFLGRVHHRRWLVVAAFVPVAVFATLQSTAILWGFQVPAASPVLGGVCIAADLAVLLRLGLLREARSRTVERHLLVVAVTVLALAPLPSLGLQWAWGQMLWPAAVMLAYGPRIGLVAIGVGSVWLGVGYDLLVGIVLTPLTFGLNTAYFVMVTGTVCATTYGAAVLTRTASQLVESRRALAVQARDAERLRLARDLHDVLGHRLSGIALVGELVRKLVPRDLDAARGHAAELETQAVALDREVDAVLRGAEAPSLAAETTAARSLLGTAGVVTYLALEVPALPPEQDELLGWAVREGVTNVLRHSDARQCTIAARVRGEAVHLDLSNDGLRPPAEGAPGGGLRGLEERVRALGGELVAGPQQGERFVLTISVPTLVAAP